MTNRMSKSELAFPRRKRTPSAQAQEYILRAADELFYNEGIRAVSVDAVVERAGINKMSLYRQFASKDELILAYVNRQSKQFWEEWETSVSKHSHQPRKQIIQFLTDLADKSSVGGYRGCCFINLAVEFPDPEHPARQLVFAHKKVLIQKLTDLTQAMGVTDPEMAAHSLALWIEGMYAASQTFGTNSDTIRMLPFIVEKLLDGAVPHHT
ncbi:MULTISPECIES: TetR/AcrR family transcriptional regulator [unclassified Paenibacillus]|uniref:TetR/AcrR family transcriptional regulator n=1 Tax=unclassified Paenibacillus TaxID=185978 RepID=UPI001B404664|nr:MULTISPECIES: TetR/AcrR family transcriptional regulator [unclassified Paenibacillus]MBP1154313.1 AcrR family transcriptional regulator [Paenibacillus sp. PvP091]MBP1170303.1 AcrR family transcriptional regulator [Paenibacillus sp. PvR098]MBP2441331.1 AcrR family transcriptional regulator [Paenibacillus sp. PvP052]